MQFGKKVYIKHHQVTAIRQLDGLDTTDLNSPQARGRWREILVDALEQVGMPYSVHGLKKLIAKAYGLKIIRGKKQHRTTAGRCIEPIFTSTKHY
jgi:hypothetical protein